MMRKITFWALAFVITVGSAVYQRTTGPTYPIEGSAEVAGRKIKYELPCSHGGEDDQKVGINIGGAPIDGVLHYKRFGVDEPFADQPMQNTGDSLIGYLPHQPVAGKLEYYVELKSNGQSSIIPGPQAVVTRFKGDVPAWVLWPHIILMFVGMLWSNRAGLEALSSKGKTKKLSVWTAIMLILGGLVLGPLVQKYAFGTFWSGVPFGWDLTDNKTLIAVAAWAFALWRHRAQKFPRYAVLFAAVVTLVVFLIPHSVMGSSLDYSTGEVTHG